MVPLINKRKNFKMNYIREFYESERLPQWLRMRSRVAKSHYSEGLPPLLVNVQPWNYILAQTLLNYASFLKMVELNNVCFCVGAGYCSSPCSLRVQV